jgi:type III pantothenate kinase
MILVMDIGNTNIVCGIYDGKKLVTYWRLASDREKSADEFGMLIINVLEYNQIPKQ